MLLDDESIFDLLGARSDVEEQVKGDDPYSSIGIQLQILNLPAAVTNKLILLV